MKNLKVIEAKGNPYEIGFLHGSLAKDEVLLSISTYKKMFFNYSNLMWEEAKKKSEFYVEYIERFDKSLLQEMQGIADGAGVELSDIISLNARSEVVMMQGKESIDGCTSMAVISDYTVDGSTILAQNWDWKGSQLDSVIILKIIPDKGPKIMMVTEAGIIGKIGFNSSGLGVCLNALGTLGNPDGVPLHIILRGILGCEKLSDALGRINQMKNACAANYLIAHKNGEALNIEKLQYDFDVFYPEKGYFVHGNHFLTTRMKVVDMSRIMAPDSFVRVGRAKRLIEKKIGSICVDDIKDILCDHVEFPDSICRHNDPIDDERFQMCTVFSIVMNLSVGKMEVAKGNPCESSFVEYFL